LSNKKKIVVGAAVAVSLLGTGATLAVWTDGATVNTAQAATGHLRVDLSAVQAFDVSALQRPTTAAGVLVGWDVSGAELASPSAIDLAVFRFSPQDRVRVVAPIDVQLQGANLLAQLDVTASASLPGQGFVIENVGIVQNVANVAAAAAWDGTGGINPQAYLIAPDGNDPFATNAGFAVFDIRFNAAGLGSQGLTAVAVLDQISASLTQVRQG